MLLSCGNTGAASPDDVGDAPKGDYGDAPDGRPTGYQSGAKTGAFPSLAKSDGARTRDVERLWLGASASSEAGLDDANDPDGRPNSKTDADDGLVDLQLNLDELPPQATLTVRVSSKQKSTRAWLNVLVDLDANGSWSPGEWVVENYKVELDDALTRPVQLPPFPYAGDAGVPQAAWMRVSVTSESIPAAWDGRGTFDAGEIEDHLVELGSSSAPLVGVDCIDPASASGDWAFDGSRALAVRCSVTPLGKAAAGGKVRFQMQRKSGGVRHSGLCGNVPAEVTSDGKSVRGGPVDLGSGSASFSCVFERNSPLPSEWTFSVPLGEAKMTPTTQGARMGVRGAATSSFNIQRGECAQCKGGAGCLDDKVCSGGCCVAPWADSCAELDPTGCGRCCALTAGARAGDCVRQACGL